MKKILILGLVAIALTGFSGEIREAKTEIKVLNVKQNEWTARFVNVEATAVANMRRTAHGAFVAFDVHVESEDGEMWFFTNEEAYNYSEEGLYTVIEYKNEDGTHYRSPILIERIK